VAKGTIVSLQISAIYAEFSSEACEPIFDVMRVVLAGSKIRTLTSRKRGKLSQHVEAAPKSAVTMPD
jgi:hypothetical protein